MWQLCAHVVWVCCCSMCTPVGANFIRRIVSCSILPPVGQWAAWLQVYAVDCCVMIPLGSGMAVHLYLAAIPMRLSVSFSDFFIVWVVTIQAAASWKTERGIWWILKNRDGKWRWRLMSSVNCTCPGVFQLGSTGFQPKNMSPSLLTSDRTVYSKVIQSRSGLEHPGRATSTHGEKSQWVSAGPATRQAHTNTYWGRQKVLLV